MFGLFKSPLSWLPFGGGNKSILDRLFSFKGIIIILGSLFILTKFGVVE